MKKNFRQVLRMLFVAGFAMIIVLVFPASIVEFRGPVFTFACIAAATAFTVSFVSGIVLAYTDRRVERKKEKLRL